MSEIILFHHAQGLTEGVRAFAAELTAAGHTVHLPDVFDGRTFDDLDSGVAYAREIGFGTLLDRSVAAAEGLSDGLVYAGFSLGVMPAQKLAQTRPGAAGALFFDACLPVDEFGAWPDALPAQIHGGVDDEWFAEDLEAARELAGRSSGVELFLYPGTTHLFTDSSLASYDAMAAGLVLERTLAFLAELDAVAQQAYPVA